MEIWYAALAMFAFVFTKAFQQRNVAFDHYWPVIPTSWAMAFTEVYVISVIVRTGYDLALVLAIGTGAGVGALGAMVVHKHMFRTRHKGVKDLFFPKDRELK
jgi:hypothetical protein